MKRKQNEDFKTYRQRLKEVAKKLKDRIRTGVKFTEIPVFTGAPKQKQYSPIEMKPAQFYSKRHKGESFSDFKDRRKACNKRRRLRE